jgi:hypothetical protein
MSRTPFRSDARGKSVLFAACLVCTLWLIVQNSILIALWARGGGWTP